MQPQIVSPQMIQIQNTLRDFSPLAFVIDIDGTLVISHKEIPGSSQALNFLAQKNIPFILLTNNISQSEQTMAREINHMLTLNEPVRPEQIILNYTPTRDTVDWENINVLLIGREMRFDEILPIKHIPKYVTIEEYCSIFPNDVPLGRRKTDERAQKIKKRVEQRLGIQSVTKQNLKFGAILIICCPINWQQCLQVIIDILNSPDGTFPTKKTSYTFEQTHIPIMATNNDFLYMVSKCNLPRLLIRPFNQMVKSTFKQIYGRELEMRIFGKPEKQTFLYAQRHCMKIFRNVENFVMIGDNPEIDIKGAVNAGWDAILLKSGVATHDMPEAKVNCTNLLEGIKEYLKMYQPYCSELP